MNKSELNGDLRRMLVVVVLYLGFASALVWFVRENPLDLLGSILRNVPRSIDIFLQVGWWVPLVILPTLFVIPWRTMIHRVPAAVVMIILCTAFFLTFSLVKTSLTFVTPFYADPLMAELDMALHGGTDPILLAHLLPIPASIDVLEPIYSATWLVPATYLPVLSTLFDSNPNRRKRFASLYLLSWVAIGNLLALIFLSGGPVYYDRILETARFEYIPDLLLQVSTSDTGLIWLHDWLWEAYQSGGDLPGSGISAFPSVHVAMATVCALYLFELDNRFWPISVLIIVLYQFLSVYLAWHYAIDGYASIVLIVVAWRLLRTRTPA